MRIWILFVCMVALFPACGDGHSSDTCGPGENMGNPRVAEGFDPGALEPELRVLWDIGTGLGAELPGHYFGIVEATTPARDGVVDAVQQTAPREITIRFNRAALSAFLETGTLLMISLEFRDRATVLDCSHPGMADRYFLDILLVFESGSLSSSQTSQRRVLGPI